MKAATATAVGILILVSLVLATMPARAATYTPTIYESHVGGYTAVKVPADGSSLSNGTTLVITCYTTNETAKIIAWGWNITIPAGNMTDRSIVVNNRTSTPGPNSTFFMSFAVMLNDTPILQLTYVLTKVATQQYDPNWLLLQQQLDQQNQQQQQHINELANPPGAKLWDPFFWVVFVIVVILLCALASFILTRMLLLVEWFHNGNIFMLGVAFLISIVNITWMAWHTDNATTVVQLVQFALMALRQAVIIGGIIGWFMGVGFARKTLDIYMLWRVDLHAKELDEIMGVKYRYKAEEKWAEQTWRAAWDRLIHDIHKKIIWANDHIARQNWKFNGFPPFNFAFINEMTEEKESVIIDCKGQNIITAIMRDAAGKRTKLILETDHSHIARALGCSLETTSHADWEVHCNHEDILIKDLDATIDRNHFLEQELLLTRIREVRKYITILNNNVLDLLYGKSQTADKDKLIAETKKMIEENLRAAAKAKSQDGEPDA